MRTLLLGLTLATLLGGIFLPACKHEPLFPGVTDPQDTIPTDVSGIPCSPDTAYFQNQILPILISHCAKSGCHDAASHEDGVVLTNYQQVMSTGKIKAFQPNDSELYEVLVESDLDDRMPLYPEPALPADKISLIRKWIEQGAQNNGCNEDIGGCNTDNITYTNFISGLMSKNCTGCHGGANPSGGIKLTTYAEVKVAAQNNGALYGSMARLPGYKPMPNGGPALPACSVEKVKAWVDAGMPQ